MFQVVLLVLLDDTGGSNTTVNCLGALFSLALTVLIIYWIIQHHNKNKSQAGVYPGSPLPSGGSPQAQGHLPAAAPLPAAGVFFGERPAALDVWGKPRGSPVPVCKPIDQDGHVLVVGGAGSGKTSCIAIPTLRDTWRAAALVVDIKGDLLTKSGRPHALVFNPLVEEAHGYDPFYLLRETRNPIPEIREIALTLCPLPEGTKEPFWIQAAQALLSGHLLYCYRHGKSFVEALQLLTQKDIKALLELEVQDEQARQFVLSASNVPEQTLGSIMQEVQNHILPLAADPDLTGALSKQDILLPTLLEQGYDVFLQLPEYKLEQWRPMIALMVQQFARHFEKRPDEGATPILFLLDEFPRLGKMQEVVTGLATLRSKKITIMPIIQSLAQLDATYGHDTRKIICDNCSYKAILGATDADTQEYFSRLVGTEERIKKTYSHEGMDLSKGEVSPWMLLFEDKQNTSITHEEKRVIRPEEFAYLTDIVLFTPQGVSRVQKRPYYLTPPGPVPVAHLEPPHPFPQPVAAAASVPPVAEVARGGMGTASREGQYDLVLGKPVWVEDRPPPMVAAPQGSVEPPTSPQTPSLASGFVGRDPMQDIRPSLPPAQASASSGMSTAQLEKQVERGEPHAQAPQAQASGPAATRATRYEAALRVAAQYAPTMPLELVAGQLYGKLPAEEQAAFLAWWQQKQARKEGGKP